MIPPITAIPMSPVLELPAMSGSATNSISSGPSFGTVLGQAFQQVNQLQSAAGSQVQAFALGESNDIHSTVIAGQKATIALQLATQIRNKVLDAYEEVMKTSM